MSLCKHCVTGVSRFSHLPIEHSEASTYSQGSLMKASLGVGVDRGTR